jgi:uncharacterized protein
MKKKALIVLDTSIFVNPDSRYLFGRTPSEAFKAFLDMLQDSKQTRCYMPPSIYEELSKFIEKMPPAQKTILIDKKPPSSYETAVPAIFVYEFIEEMRLRMNKGLRIAEKYSRKTVKSASEIDKRSHEESVIKTLRQEYRTALREGVVDSRQDFDLILLSKELDAYLATTDNGLIHWAQKLGISCINPQELKEMVAR